MDVTWRIELLGQLAVSEGERRIERFRTRRAALLLARLALSHSPIRRDVLVEWLWPDCNFELGRNRLSVALTTLRRQLESPQTQTKLFLGNHDSLGLNWDAVQTDVEEFDAHLKRANIEENTKQRATLLSESLTMWAGPVWSGEDTGALRDEARGWNELYYEAAITLAELDAPSSLEPLRIAQKMSPTREDIARTLMRSLTATGREDEARRVWRNLESVLRTEWNRSPAAETRSLAHHLFNGASPPLSVPSLPTLKGHLQSRSNRFFGRETELETLSNWLSPQSDIRLITISGGSGHGKTRLALEASRRNAQEFRGEIYPVFLAGQSDARRVLGIIGDVLRAPRLSGASELERIVRALGSRRVLLLLDNFEHLAPAAPDIERLLARARGLVCLCTSRRLLGLQEERPLVLHPLPLPAPSPSEEGNHLDATLLGEWTRNPAMRLFVDRARTVSPNFRVHTRNASDVARLCRSLEGVPLALELAAARVLALSPAQIQEYLKSRLDVLEQQPTPDQDSRHRSLRAALDWSYDLLSPDEKRIFRRLSIFRGSWTLQQATNVCALTLREDADLMLKVHEELRRHSLLEAEDESEELRFRFAETVRLYAQERALRHDKPQLRHALQLQHARTFADLSRKAARSAKVEFPREGTHILEREILDLQAAFEWSLSNDPSLALQLAVSLWWLWFSTSRLDEGRTALKRALDASRNIPDDSLSLWDKATADNEAVNWRTEALSGAGFLAWRQGDLTEAVQLCTQALEQSRSSKGERAQIYSLLVLQLASLVQGEFETARTIGEECLATAKARSDQFVQAFALHLLGAGAEMTGDAHLAWSLQEQSHTLFHLIGSIEGEGWALFNWGNAARRLGEYSRAVSLCQRARQIFEQFSSREGMAYSDFYTALALHDSGDKNKALPLLRASLRELLELNARWGIAMALEGLSFAVFDGTTDAATLSTRLWSTAQLLRSQIGAPVPPVDQSRFNTFEAELQTTLSPPSFEAAWSTGQALSLAQAVDAALKS